MIKMQRKEDIVVVGGYGHVGHTICEILEEKYPGKVYAAGRSLEKAERFSQSTDGKVKPLQLDISKPLPPHRLDHVKLIIMCLDQTDTRFVRACFQSGTDYVDVSANGFFLSQIEKYRNEAEQHGSSAILSVGLAPGITNLLALEAERQLYKTDEVNLAIMLGLGDTHGKAAIEWTLSSLGERFEVKQQQRQVEVKSFTDRKAFNFGNYIGRRYAYRFPFSDQQTLARTLKAPTISTRFCLDSVIVTKLLAILTRTGIVGLLHKGWLNKWMTHILGQFHLGGDRFAIKVEALGSNREGKALIVELLLEGKNQSTVTAMVTAAVCQRLIDSPLPGGVYHIEQVTNLAYIQKELEEELSLETQISAINR